MCHILTDECNSDQFTCGQSAVNHCVPLNFVCDGNDDCGDASDESLDNCTCLLIKHCHNVIHYCVEGTSPTNCSTNQFTCANGQCIQQQFVCDSDDDCGDNSDELEDCCMSGCTKHT